MRPIRSQTKQVLISAASILVAASTWVFNLGWLRLLLLPLVAILHCVLFFFVNQNSARYFENDRRIKVLNFFFILTFIIGYVCLPDSDDIRSYVFWGLVNDETIVNIAQIVSTVSFVVHIGLLVGLLLVAKGNSK